VSESTDEPQHTLQLPRVAASEADLIELARALVSPGAKDVWPVLARQRKLPSHIGPSSARLVEEALRHVWPALWRRHGSAQGTSLSGQRGRGWERNQPLPLEYSPATIKFLRWLVASPFAAPASMIEPLHVEPLTVGDQVVVYLALDLTAGTPAQARIAMQPFLRGAPLAHLGFPHLAAPPRPTFESLVTGAGAIVVEALGPDLARRWHEIELAKRALSQPDDVVKLGAAQEQVLAGFMATCDRAGRRDLAAFVLDVAARMVARGTPPVSALDPTTSLTARSAARQAAGALLRGVVRWSEWDEEHRTVRFIDDGYAAAQVLLARFEQVGQAGMATIRQWLVELASLAPTPATIENP
jgi:hypothetical protein